MSALTDGAVTGNFSDSAPISSQAISQNGTYYSFLLKATDVGMGAISFDSASTIFAATSTGFNFAPLPHGESLNFQVVPNPEPSAAMLVGVGALLGPGWMWRGRRLELKA